VDRSVLVARMVLSWKASGRYVLLALAISVTTLEAQSGYISVGYAGPPPDPEGFISVPAPAICRVGDNVVSDQSLPDGGYVKVSNWPTDITEIRIDAHGSISGHCDFWWGGNYYPPGWDRVMAHIIIDSAPPTLLSSRFTIYGGGNGYSNDFDTRVPNDTTGPWGTRLDEPGEWQFLFKSVTFPTECSFPTESAVVSRTVHVMTCRPRWFTPADNSINYHGPATGDVVIGVPPGFTNAIGPAQAAAADWQAALGRPVYVLTNHTCSVNDPLCIGFTNDHGTRDGDEGCASLDTASFTGAGVWTGATAVRFEPDWTGAHPEALRRLIAHEMGHYFGLGNRLTCGTNDSIMSAFSNCYTDQPMPVGTIFGPTASDASATLHSTYGDHVRTTCGFPSEQ
jgi:hypothetical protein